MATVIVSVALYVLAQDITSSVIVCLAVFLYKSTKLFFWGEMLSLLSYSYCLYFSGASAEGSHHLLLSTRRGLGHCLSGTENVLAVLGGNGKVAGKSI